MVADANYGLPLAQVVTTAKRNDSPLLPPVMMQAEGLYDWFDPEAAMADRGYDAVSNFQWLFDRGIEPVILKKRTTKKETEWGGIFTQVGTPTCMGQVPMEYLLSDGQGRRLYRCPTDGCHLLHSTKGGIRHCDTVLLSQSHGQPAFIRGQRPQGRA